MTRLCECGCLQPVTGRGRFVAPSHRAAHWRTQHVVQAPVGPGPRSGVNNRSGRQISFEKAVRVMAMRLWITQALPSHEDCLRQARFDLGSALSERQQGQS